MDKQTEVRCIVIPAYEPSESLIRIAKETWHGGDRELIVVDDGSSDRCAGIWEALRPYAKILHHEVNRGKGEALKTAYRYIAENMPCAASIVTADADGQHLIQDIEAVEAAAAAAYGTLILGVRDLSKMPPRSVLGNSVVRRTFARISGVRVSDTQTGLRGFDSSLLELMITIPGSRYEYEMNVLLYCGLKKVPIQEVGIETVYEDRKNSTSHFHPVRDSVRILKTMQEFERNKRRGKL